nr:hypothetical protein CFP56_50571 [Quercus suber]
MRRYSTSPICVSPEARFGRGGSGLFGQLGLRLRVARNTTQQLYSTSLLPPQLFAASPVSSLTLYLSHIPNPDTHTRRQGDIGSSNIGSTTELVGSRPSIIYRINQSSTREVLDGIEAVPWVF